MTDTAAVWRAHADALRRFLASRVEPDAVEDLLQDLFVKVHEKVNHLRDEDRLTAWVYQIARNLIVDHYRTRKVDAQELANELAEPLDDESREVLVDCMVPFVDQLSDTYRDAVRMSELEGLTQREVAERLGLSLSGAKSRVQRGRESIRRMLDDCCQFHRDSTGTVREFKERPEGECGC